MIGESGPEAVIPLSKMGSMGFGGGNTITVNVNGGDPNNIVRALQQYVRNSGPLPVSIQ
jgi:phosphotransferase system HPr-like phosphotransfer protein